MAEERQSRRFLGMPTHGEQSFKNAQYEKRVLGLPQSWWGQWKSPFDLRFLRHPIQWAQWRYQVKKLGPYAPRFTVKDKRSPSN